MKKMSLMLGICSLVFLGCQKERQSQEQVKYSGYYLQSPDDASKLVTEKEYDKIMASKSSEKMDDRGKGKVTCYFPNKDGETYSKGTACKTTVIQSCEVYDGCHLE